MENERDYFSFTVRALLLVFLSFGLIILSGKSIKIIAEGHRHENEIVAKISDEFNSDRFKTTKSLVLVEKTPINYPYLIYRVRYLIYPKKTDFALLIDSDLCNVSNFDYRTKIENFKAVAPGDGEYKPIRPVKELMDEYDIIILIKNQEVSLLKNI